MADEDSMDEGAVLTRCLAGCALVAALSGCAAVEPVLAVETAVRWISRAPKTPDASPVEAQAIEPPAPAQAEQTAEPKARTAATPPQIIMSRREPDPPSAGEIQVQKELIECHTRADLFAAARQRHNARQSKQEVSALIFKEVTSVAVGVYRVPLKQAEGMSWSRRMLDKVFSEPRQDIMTPHSTIRSGFFAACLNNPEALAQPGMIDWALRAQLQREEHHPAEAAARLVRTYGRAQLQSLTDQQMAAEARCSAEHKGAGPGKFCEQADALFKRLQAMGLSYGSSRHLQGVTTWMAGDLEFQNPGRR